VVLVATVSAAVVPVKFNQVTVDGEAHDAARWMDDYAAERELTFPRNRVFSWWGSYRMYNYFVTEYAVPNLRYSYARHAYVSAMGSADPAAVYERHAGEVGFVVTTDRHRPSVAVVNGSVDLSVYARLHDHLGSRTDGVAAVTQFRGIYASPDGSVKVFQPVRGASVTGTAPPNATVALSTTVRLGGVTAEYRRTATADADGTYAATVPYAGRYEIGAAAGSATVPESAVLGGETVAVDSADATASATRSVAVPDPRR
jgi:dolichyl-diphosphooligosaccharide--protein glycosyltransferase